MLLFIKIYFLYLNYIFNSRYMLFITMFFYVIAAFYFHINFAELKTYFLGIFIFHVFIISCNTAIYYYSNKF